MENFNAIKKRMKSVNGISQMTNAMQLVSSAKMRRSLILHESMYPFFSLCAESMQEIRNNTSEIDNPFFRLNQKKEGDTWKIGYFVLSGDQGLAGAYNNNMVKITEEHIQRKILENTRKNLSTEYELNVFGKLAREKLLRSGYNVNPEFSFPISEPTFYQARSVSAIMRHKFLNNEYDLIYLLYTKMESSIKMVPVAVRLLPVDVKAMSQILPDNLDDAGMAMSKGTEIEYMPNPNSVFDYLIDTYTNAIVYGAMVEAYASEQTARLTAMQNATENADEMMKHLELLSNRARQARITTELTEIVNGAEQANNM
ncbi:MAG: ATP synthase F1 subunit gamma [Saccharofermentans sp.]|jgi:F-type H+-transporting ATPase subunit gamma|nr:ATP synthase F1 subunit gamma [Mageeibacillus sp.]MCI1263647.1 ATP synthase F1 subunit gamma [Saccharofermentans sp.]MCI1274728.1 ATP synthase F1 subunit gamma [Saccharofermentans sp.]MCI1769342.1 ATP synthase F1 subunit gamma [Mageeibacillus sp.]MCI2043659.1 ATP synthase F1 subunit gamma [Mageeibacillus sp.]